MKFLRHRLLVSVCLLLSLVIVELGAEAQEQTRQQHVGRVLDWSYHHLVLSGGLAAVDLDGARAEPRILFRLVEHNSLAAVLPASKQFDRGDRRPSIPFRPKRRGLKVDWSVPLGTGIVAPNMFPAKYSFDVNAAPSCANDYVVFGFNVAGVMGGQANLIGLNQLYRGTNGLCGAGSASVNWAYNGSTGGGSVLTSPVISLDGTKIAYVESAGASAIFHVLTWKAAEGTSATVAAIPTLNGVCTASTSCLKSVTFSATSTDTLASPWVDYLMTKHSLEATTVRYIASVASLRVD